MSFIRAPRRTKTRRWLFQIHLWLGLILGPVIGIVGLTGAVVVFRYELNRLTTPGTAYVRPQGERLSIDELAARVQRARPGDTLRQAGWGEAGPDNAWNFRSQSSDGHRIHTYINQYTGEITGTDDYQGKWMQWFFDLHAQLLAGDTGEFLNGFVGLATVILGLTGLVVWWPGLAHWTFGFRYLWGARWKRQNYDLHKVVGFYTSMALAVVAFTGAYFAFPSLYQKGAEAVTGTKVTVGAPKASTHWSERRVPLEEFIRAAERAQPGAHAVSFGFPQNLGEPVTVRTKEENDWHRIGLNYVYMEPADATIVRSDRFSDVTLGTQAILFVYPLHFGRFGGRVNPAVFYGVMVVYVVIGIAPFVLMVTGLLMYLEPFSFEEVEAGDGAPTARRRSRAVFRSPAGCASFFSPRGTQALPHNGVATLRATANGRAVPVPPRPEDSGETNRGHPSAAPSCIRESASANAGNSETACWPDTASFPHRAPR